MGESARRFIRHPSDIPIEIDVQKNKFVGERLRNVSLGGVAFGSPHRIEIGSVVDVCIRTVHPAFRARGRVAWCLPRRDHFDIGVQFVEHDDAFRARMVEQICHIEHYKREVLGSEGRVLTGEQAALEWIEKFAADFPGAGKNE